MNENQEIIKKILKKANDKNIKLVNLNDKENTLQTYINSIYYKREDSFAKAKIIGLDNIGNNND